MVLFCSNNANIGKGNADIEIADKAFGSNRTIMPYRSIKFPISPMPVWFGDGTQISLVGLRRPFWHLPISTTIWMKIILIIIIAKQCQTTNQEGSCNETPCKCFIPFARLFYYTLNSNFSVIVGANYRTGELKEMDSFHFQQLHNCQLGGCQTTRESRVHILAFAWWAKNFVLTDRCGSKLLRA